MDVLIHGAGAVGLGPDTAEPRSSMRQAITAGTQAEIDAFSGAAIQLAQQHGLAVPYNLAVHDLLEFLETARPGKERASCL